ncbi:MAG: neutral/alkaline non-lysosomal ceramidase N-terminal domain-containing protein [Aggregatilineales bacterium]
MTLQAGIGKRIITPRVGVPLVGYGNRASVSQGVHDDLLARAVVIDDGATQIALCSIELLWLRKEEVAAIRAAVCARCALPDVSIFLFCTHTHSGPAGHSPDQWDFSLIDRIAEAIVEAYETRAPARIGFGFGQLFGYNINRRWLNRPADPSVGVMRVDHADGTPLALLGNYACHAVVLGYDNYLISGDWPGYSSRLLEAELGALALFSQGGAGDINPLTETVRQRLAAGHPVAAIGDVSFYYGYQPDQPDAWNIGDRGGGTFIECETLARAYNAEVMRVWRRIETSPALSLWTERVEVEAAIGPDEPPAQGVPLGLSSILAEEIGASILLDIRLVGIGSAVLLGQPGEVFSQTAVDFRAQAQRMGYPYPLLISFANGSYAYLPPADAFLEGGYEVSWPLGLGISRYTQNRIAKAIEPLLHSHGGGHSLVSASA